MFWSKTTTVVEKPIKERKIKQHKYVSIKEVVAAYMREQKLGEEWNHIHTTMTEDDIIVDIQQRE